MTSSKFRYGSFAGHSSTPLVVTVGVNVTIVVVGNNVGEYVGIFVSTVGIAGDVVGEVLITGGGVVANSGLEVPKTGASVSTLTGAVVVETSLAGKGAGEKVESDTAGEAVVLLLTGAAVSSSPGVPTTAIGDIVGRYVGMYVVGAVVFVAACRFLVLILLPSTLLLLGSSFSSCSNSRRSCIV